MLRSAVAAVKNAALHPKKCRQLNPVLLSRLMGLQFRCYTAQTTPDSNSSEQTNQQDQRASDPQKKADEPAKESKESEHDRLLREKEELLKDLQVCYMRCDI